MEYTDRGDLTAGGLAHIWGADGAGGISRTRHLGPDLCWYVLALGLDLLWEHERLPPPPPPLTHLQTLTRASTEPRALDPPRDELSRTHLRLLRLRYFSRNHLLLLLLHLLLLRLTSPTSAVT